MEVRLNLGYSNHKEAAVGRLAIHRALSAAYCLAALVRRFVLPALFLLGDSPSTIWKDASEVTNFFKPASSKSTVVRSSSHATTVPRPYWAWRTNCPGFMFMEFPIFNGAGRRVSLLDQLDIGGLEPLGPLGDFEAHPRTLFEGPVSLAHYRGVMYEDVVTALALNKPVAFGAVEPLHCSVFLHG